MPVKRSHSESASASPPSSPIVTPKSECISDEGDEYAPTPPSSPTPTKRARASPSKPKQAKVKQTPVPSSSSSGRKDWEPGWSADKKEAIVARYLAAGIKALTLADMCKEFNLTSAQLSNAIQHGHKNNLRDKAAKGAR